ncbi:MAG: response regulator transcription factor [Mesorhizobium sp.]|uniref:LuxR C-terminal-related transcriptional regulator n=1 Tax=unclassified Mesorhizobium TaxID=325217 RepID=UPI000FC9E78A|nr:MULTISPECIES: response regulator transcription factor [unclassified Mesorhizobium]RUV72381.1 response regulator transcription factor [Mesorhizobium sp. M5C.F.Cr.IN.023.01.1.1]RWF88271.1 MAG: response regulator transcription factor [Mesorhizobium sp.]RWF93109.1 MAG: response regulator transcription factor [Mesorhizobium sp.]RWI42360.1 MAG: response regulator transcription factor [Mesorhizobium sp.]RWI53572.1 MAG: response regulator transcription factor [Mesorhizobium sp.]
MGRQSFLTLLVGPSGLLRESLIRILDKSKFRIAFSADSVHDLLLKPLPQCRPILLIIDVDCSDASSGFEQIADFKENYPDSHVVVLADHYQLDDVVSAFRSGANAYLTKFTAYDTFIKSLELVLLGQSILPAEALPFLPSVKQNLEPEHKKNPSNPGVIPEHEERVLSMLSPREICVLGCLTEGKSNKIIARKFHIADATVKVHVKTILRKIRVRNRTQAAVWAMNNGLLTKTVSGHAWASDQYMTAEPRDTQDLVERHADGHLESTHPI